LVVIQEAPPRHSTLSPAATVSLDVIRALAAQIVVVGHTISTSGTFMWIQPPRFPFIQNIGVLVFFTISGLLICRTARESARARPGFTFGIYLFERATRIYSGLIPALIFIVVADVTAAQFASGRYAANLTVLAFAGNLVFLQGYPASMLMRHAHLAANVTDVPPLGSGRPLWTLSVEWWLYVFFGAMFLRWPQSKLGRAATLALFLASAPMILLYAAGTAAPGLIAAWFIGAAAVWLLDLSSGAASWWRLGAAAAVIATVGAVSLPRMAATGYDFQASVAVALGVVWLLVWAQSRKSPVGALWARSAHFVASYSYTLYLIHYSLILFLKATLPSSPYIFDGLAIIGSNLVALAIATLGELHYKSLRRMLAQSLGIKG
jgi:peptidoglycan/LPS O-acetylase OafA/YrhL